MSARDRAFSNLDRESLQEFIDANHERAKDWIKKREQKFAFLEESVITELISEAQEALFSLTRRLNFETQQEAVKALWDISDALSVWYKILERPQNVKVAVKEITAALNKGLDDLVRVQVWTRRNSE